MKILKKDMKIECNLKKYTSIFISLIIILLLSELAYGNSNVSANTTNVSYYNVSLESEPLGSNIIINETFKGETPKSLQLPSGVYQIVLTHPDYKNSSITINVTNEDVKKNIKLERLIFTWDEVFYFIVGSVSIYIIIVFLLYEYYKNKNTKLSEDLYHFKEMSDDQKGTIDKLKNKLKQYSDTPIERISENLEQMHEEISSCKKENAGLKSINSELQRTNSDLKDKKLELEESLDDCKTQSSRLRNEIESLVNTKKSLENRLQKFEQFIDINELHKEVDININLEQDLKKWYADFDKEKKVLKDIYALEVLEPLYDKMGQIYYNADVSIIKGYPLYSPKKVYLILKDIDMKLDKNQAFMQCLRALKYRRK